MPKGGRQAPIRATGGLGIGAGGPGLPSAAVREVQSAPGGIGIEGHDDQVLRSLALRNKLRRLGLSAKNSKFDMSFDTEAKQEGNGEGTTSEAGRTPRSRGRRLQVGSTQRQITTRDSACLLSAILEGANDEVESVLNSTTPIVMGPGAMWPLYDVPEDTDVDGLIPELYIFESELETETDPDVGPFYIPVPDYGDNQFFNIEEESMDPPQREESKSQKKELQEGRPQGTRSRESQIQMLERGSMRDQFLVLPEFYHERKFGDSGDSGSFLASASREISESSELAYERGRDGSVERDGKSSSTSSTRLGGRNSIPVEGQPPMFLSTIGTDISEGACAAQMMEVMNGGLEDAQTLANRGIGANTRDNRGRTVLMKAAMGGNLEFVNALINTSTNFDLQDKCGCTALIWAAVSGQEDIVSLLLEKGADVDIQNKYGSTALIMAAMNGKLGIVNTLMSSSPNINVQDKFGRTALMKAAMNAKLEVVNVLINGGANVDVQDKSGETVLMKVAMVGNIEISNKLISSNADLDLHDENGQTAIMKAATFGRREITNALITGGASLNLRDKAGETALMHAATDGCVDIVDALVTGGANMDDEDQNGRTTLVKAAIDGNLDIVNLLISSGANVNVPDKMGRTAYHQAMKMGHREIARVLRREGTYKDVERCLGGAPIPEGSAVSIPMPRRRTARDDPRHKADISDTGRRQRSHLRSTSALPNISAGVSRDEALGIRAGPSSARGAHGNKRGQAKELKRQAVEERAPSVAEGEAKPGRGRFWRLGKFWKSARASRRAD